MSRQIGGSSAGDHFAAAAKQLGKPKPKAPPLPPCASHLWDTYGELARRRQLAIGMGAAPQPITHQDIMAWVNLKQWPLAPWEVDAIVALDDAYLADQA